MQLETLRKSCSIRLLGTALIAGLSLCMAAQAMAADDAAITPFSTAAPGEPPASWKFATLPNKVATKYSIVDLSGTRALKVEADESYGNLVHNVKAQVTDHSVLSWSWRVDKLVDEADLKVRAGEDSAAKLCVFFAFDVNKLSLGERTRLSIARNTIGQDVPTETPVTSGVLPSDSSLNIF